MSLWEPAAVQAVRTDREGQIATITLANADRNLLDPAVMADLHDAISRADDDPDIRAVVLTGTADVFCGGLDVAQMQNDGNPVEFATALVTLLKLIPEVGTATVAAVNGDALASGFSIVCACDLVVATPQARLGTFEASVGIWPMIAQVPPLQRLLPRHALQNIITGVPFTADEALRFGAINRIVDASELGREARELAVAASGAGAALAAGRRSFYRYCDLSYQDALDDALLSFTAMFESADSHQPHDR
ncbi:enoyl-CoA hydratase/isomerase family protein [Pseudonocardia sp. N23]|uniref:enoyl-CoA hydratase/isomerase family protein n=1 Tax=Pseudonocardia sp. N23 TaxID=1987376 RepID=UPI000BFD0775|nr:enoyl-CoA hydratase/isomerase family protein [Pseudonocardia sp. N23]GAY07669.1 enoyl-CoA hydratase [Pseudonocardia sp. N23]